MADQQVVFDIVLETQPQERSLRQALSHRQEDIVECPVCFGEHDEDIHAASVSIRRWHRFMVTRDLDYRPLTPQ